MITTALTLVELAIIFVFAALFLGEVRSYYVRFWWWDIVVGGASGLLPAIGVLGGSFMKAKSIRSSKHGFANSSSATRGFLATRPNRRAARLAGA